MSKIRKENGLVVLSLFDGMSCGRLALEKAGIKVDKYLASEIKPFAIKHTLDKFPDTVSLGDVTKLHYNTKTKTLLANCTRETIDKIGVKEDLDIKDFSTKKDLEDRGLDIIDGKVCKVKFTDEELANFDKLGYELEDASGEVIKWTGGDPKYVGDIDLLIGGSPCFTGDTLVLTNRGLVRIKDIEVGDLVLSHDKCFHKVTKVMNQGTKNIYSIKAMNFDEIRTTSNHKFYVRKKTESSFEEPTWVEIKDLAIAKNDYFVGSAINQESKMPIWNGVDIPVNQFETRHQNSLDMTDKTFWYIVGRYLGDGWLTTRKGDYRSTNNGFIICCGKDELEALKEKVGDKYSYSISEERTTYRMQFSNVEFAAFLAQFGEKALGKKLPGFVFDMPIELLESMLNGYLDSDGCYIEKIGKYQTTSISKELTYGIANIVEKVYKTPCAIYFTEVAPTKIIENRVVNQNNFYMTRFRKDFNENDRAFYENGYTWYPISSIDDLGVEEEVFDISVEAAHSFMANNTIVHNCQDFSTANSFGKGAYGLQGPKSRLFYEYNRLRHEVNPNFYLLENVKMRKDSEARLNDYMEVNGTHVNGALVSPTNRPRVYWTNIYDGNPIPQPTDLKISFQDYKLQTLPNIERMLYMEKYPMCYELFDASTQKELDPYVEKDEAGKVIKGVVTITEDDIAKICTIPSNVWVRKELEEAYGHTLSDKEFVDELHAILQEAYVKKSPSRDKMYKGDAKGRFKCKDITNEEKMSCITRKQDRFPNAGLITIGDGLYCRFVTKLEMCKGQSIPYSFVNTLSYANISDILGDGWQRDIIAHIFEGLKDKYDFS